MKKKPLYTEHPAKVVSVGKKFEHIMAITLNPQNHHEGIIRCIVSRDGDVGTSGYIDRSQLFTIHGTNAKKFAIGEQLIIHGSDSIIKKLSKKYLDFIGLEDPDLFYDAETTLFHLYFTMAFIGNEKHPSHIHLGHAAGTSLKNLEMTMPVLTASKSHNFAGAKEVSIAPVNSKGIRYNLFESSDAINDEHYSVVRVATARAMGKPWKFGKIAFHPAEHKTPWIGGHASPGPLLPRSFIDLGDGRMLGIMNGREANRHVGPSVKYGKFSIGLFIYDYDHGVIEWVSPKFLIRDSEAKTITFASQFIETKPGEGILYAHIDDSFVRAYTVRAAELIDLLPKK